MPGNFISYRRADSEAIVGRIADGLVARFGQQAVFKDIDSISFGKDFRKQLEDALDRCDVMLAVVGLHSLQDAAGKRLLESRSDWMRFELERAIARKIHVIPVLVNGAPTVTAEVLPESLQELAYYPQMKLDAGIDYHNHKERLIDAILKCLPETPANPPAEIRHSGPHASSHTPHHHTHHPATRLAEATPHRKFGGAEATLSISVVGFLMLLAVLDRNFGSSSFLDDYAVVARLELPWIAFLITAPSIFVCNYILEGPFTWRTAWSDRPVVSVLLRGLARTIEASCWLFGVWMAFLWFVASSDFYPGVTADYFAVMIAISVLTAATAIYLFLYKWRWAKALRGSQKT